MTDEHAAARDREAEELIRRIVSNPLAAEIAYPDPEVRQSILPLLVSTRQLVEKRQKRK